MVATRLSPPKSWYEMRGTGTIENSSRGYGILGTSGVHRCPRTNFGAACHTVPYGTGHVFACSQAFHARLQSFRPYGTLSSNKTWLRRF